MFHFLVFLLTLYQLSPVTFSETVDTSKFSVNNLHNDDYNPKSQKDLSLLQAIDYPIIKSSNEETEIDFNDLTDAINMLKKQRQKELAMSINTNFMRFGKRQIESMPAEQAVESFEPGTRFERSNGAEGIRDSRRDNFIRFGRSGAGSQFMRLGRAPSDFMRFGRNPTDFMRFGRNPSDFMRFGRSTPSDFMRFGRSPSDFMRFGRAPSDFMRFGRKPSDFMRFGRAASNFIRFGRNPSTNFMRLGRSPGGYMRTLKSDKLLNSPVDKNFMRFGRPDSFMRFGRASSIESDTNPNFMRFGKRQKNETNQKSIEHNQTDKTTTVEESTTSYPSHELETEVDPMDMMFLNELTDSEDKK